MKAAVLASFLLAAALVTTGIASPLQSGPRSDEVNDIDVNNEQLNHEWVSEDFLEQGDPSEAYLQEIREQLESRSNNNQPARNTRSTDSVIQQGNTIALQPLYNKRSWLGCSTNPCSKATCPGMYMEGGDWTNCYGEVFQIYRLSGPGTVAVGDLVGIYYPKESGKWLGCAGSLCGKAGCPGKPTTEYGFENNEKWFQCYSEVFKIYARGKSLGEPIEAHDDVTLYYVYGQNWVGLADHQVDHDACPGTVRPPPNERYEACWGENFEIWKQ